MTLSIIMCAYNMERTLPNVLLRLIDSEPEAEIILIDDGSTDTTLEIGQEFAKKHPKLKVHSIGKNVGLLKARQIGYNLATGTHIAFMDADDYITKTYYSELAKICPEGGFSMGRTVKYGIKVRKLSYNGEDPYKWYINSDKLKGQMTYQLTYIWNKVFSRTLTDKMFKGWNLPYMVHLEDTVFMSRAFTFCRKVEFGDKGAYIQPKPSLTCVPRTKEERLPCYKVAYDLMCRYMVEEDVRKVLQIRWKWDGFDGEFNPDSISK